MAEHRYVILDIRDVGTITDTITNYSKEGGYELVSVVPLAPPKVLIVFRRVNPLFGAAQRLAEAYSDYFHEGTSDQYKALEAAWRVFEELRRD